MPKWAVDAPQLHAGLEFPFGAFFDLTGDRQSGMGVGPIPYMVLRSYGEAQGLEDEDLEEFIYLLREMDREFLSYNQEVQERRRQRGV